MNTVCFTGRRPKDLCGYQKENYAAFVDALETYLEAEFADKGVKNYITGGAQGFDQLAFWAVNRLKKKYPDIKNIVYVPFKGQDSIWKEDGLFSKKEYRTMILYADQCEFLYNVNLADRSEVARALLGRNAKMVDDSDAIIALYPDNSFINAKSGGTADCMKYAAKHGKTIFQIQYKIKNNILDFNKVEVIAPKTPPTLQEYKGDIFKIPHGEHEAMCVTTNGMIKKDGTAVMGKGIALEVDRRYHVSKALAEHIQKNGNVPGDLGICKSGFHILSFPTKEHWKNASDLNLIVESAKGLVKLADELHLTRVFTPRPGCANGGLDWEEVKSAISDIFDDRFCVIDLESSIEYEKEDEGYEK